MMNKLCEYKVNFSEPCPHRAKVKIEIPNPVDPSQYPKLLCYSHLSAIARILTGQFTVTKMQEGQ